MSKVPKFSAFIICIGWLLAACKADTTGLATLTVAQLDSLLAEEPAPVLCDANTEETRERYGIIPGARLLSSYRDFDPAVELPPDREGPLVSYCHSEYCSAAATAARRAVVAGYTAVYVLPAGIKGWLGTGRSSAKPPS